MLPLEKQVSAQSKKLHNARIQTVLCNAANKDRVAVELSSVGKR